MTKRKKLFVCRTLSVFVVVSFVTIVTVQVVQALSTQIIVAGGQLRNSPSENISNGFVAISNTLTQSNTNSIGFTFKLFEDGFFSDIQARSNHVTINKVGNQELIAHDKLDSAKYYYQLIGDNTNGNGRVQLDTKPQ